MNRAKYIANVFSIGCMMAFAVVFSGCHKGESCLDFGSPTITEFTIPASQKVLIPYSITGFDTLIFESEQGDIATLYGTGVKNGFDTLLVSRSSDPGCPFYDYQKRQTLTYNFQGSSPLLNRLVFFVFIDTDGDNYVYVQPQVDNRIYQGRLYFISDELYYSDKVIANGNEYKALGLIARSESAKTMFYNKSYGIIRLKSHNLMWNRKF